MKRKLLARRPSPAMVVAVVALVSSLAGGAVAATLITGDDIAKNAIAKKHIKKNAVVSKKVKDGSLLSKDFKAGELPAGAAGPQGPPGAKGDACLPTIPECVGPKGDKGDPGTNGTNGTNGATGPVGPTAGFVDYCCFAPDGDTTIATTTVTTPTAGKLWVTATHDTTFTCGAGACSAFFSLQVDGATVPNATSVVRGAASETKRDSFNVIGLTGTLPAGDHTITLRRGTNSGAPASFNNGLDTIGAILLGG